MRVIPVVDILGGQVVHAIAGERRQYQPLVSPLLDGPTTPASVTRLFVDTWGLEQIYVADLDAIAGAAPCWDEYAGMMNLGARLWVDAGIRTDRDAERLADFRTGDGCLIERVIVGLESLADASSLDSIVRTIGAERAVFSLDLDDGRPRTAVDAWRTATPRDIVVRARDAGFRRLIVLDLRRVGTGTGPGTTDLIEEWSNAYPDVEWIAGGGVRGRDDLAVLRAAGCHAALVASALHGGQLQFADVK